MKNLIIITMGVLLLANSAFSKQDKEKRQKGLPPGLEKKINNGGSLPPGWKKKLEVGKPIDKDVYKHGKIVVPVDDKGLVTVEIGGKLVQLYKSTREVVKILK